VREPEKLTPRKKKMLPPLASQQRGQFNSNLYAREKKEPPLSGKEDVGEQPTKFAERIMYRHHLPGEDGPRKLEESRLCPGGKTGTLRARREGGNAAPMLGGKKHFFQRDENPRDYLRQGLKKKECPTSCLARKKEKNPRQLFQRSTTACRHQEKTTSLGSEGKATKKKKNREEEKRRGLPDGPGESRLLAVFGKKNLVLHRRNRWGKKRHRYHQTVRPRRPLPGRFLHLAGGNSASRKRGGRGGSGHAGGSINCIRRKGKGPPGAEDSTVSEGRVRERKGMCCE